MRQSTASFQVIESTESTEHINDIDWYDFDPFDDPKAENVRRVRTASRVSNSIVALAIFAKVLEHILLANANLLTRIKSLVLTSGDPMATAIYLLRHSYPVLSLVFLVSCIHWARCISPKRAKQAYLFASVLIGAFLLPMSGVSAPILMPINMILFLWLLVGLSRDSRKILKIARQRAKERQAQASTAAPQ